MSLKKFVEEHKEEQQQIWEKVQQLDEQLQQFRVQHNHLIEPDPMSTVVKGSNPMVAAYDMIRVLLEHLDQVTHEMMTKNDSNDIEPVSYWKRYHKKKSGSYSFIWDLATNESYLQEVQATAHPLSKPQKDVRLQVLDNLQTLCQVKGRMPAPYDELGNLLEAGIKYSRARASGK
ncbi:unnamed protein product [Sphagnum troendelagicum]|uniref:Uncharacterized protein n=1 Tax=Sphagnum troendelagicum TaxID=128251 RepID=A0ABP0T8Z6_9BRYO